LGALKKAKMGGAGANEKKRKIFYPKKNNC